MGKVILADVSGSMAEEGKKSVVKYALYAIQNLWKEEWPNAAPTIYLWNEEIVEYEEKIDFKGQVSSKALAQFLEQHRGEEVLLLGDGNYPEEIRNVFRRSENIIMALMIGADCNRARLQKLFGAENVYETVDVAACIANLMDR